MDNFNEYLPTILGVLFLVIIWFIIRRLFASISDKINNSETYKEDTVRVLEEIRDELKELNRNNSK
ncbi:hypothetical protein [Flavobacterium humidisoli]|uniref:DUF4083 domain-containing protein n=1 Tax=Flavobacterium humidisoli TaxID=2937442 RepID=A0ABY4LQ86_9FLAO|nr:hypothetical protein [Flavobacterium humidisoli]UPZ15252.1 hypothetical protein M0M44_21150 [Flavobacterium humidisoli]